MSIGARCAELTPLALTLHCVHDDQSLLLPRILPRTAAPRHAAEREESWALYERALSIATAPTERRTINNSNNETAEDGVTSADAGVENAASMKSQQQSRKSRGQKQARAASKQAKVASKQFQKQTPHAPCDAFALHSDALEDLAEAGGGEEDDDDAEESEEGVLLPLTANYASWSAEQKDAFMDSIVRALRKKCSREESR